MKEWYAYDPSFTGGVYVAASADPALRLGVAGRIVTGAGEGGGPHVREFDYASLTVTRQFYAYDPKFTGGVRIATGPSAGWITTAPGPGGGPHVEMFDAAGVLQRQFFAYDAGFRGGVFVSSSSMFPTASDGFHIDVVVSPGSGGPSDIRLFDSTRANVAVENSFRSLEPYAGFQGGVHVALIRGESVDTYFRNFIVTAPGPGGGPDVRIYQDDLTDLGIRINPFDLPFIGGVNVG